MPYISHVSAGNFTCGALIVMLTLTLPDNTATSQGLDYPTPQDTARHQTAQQKTAQQGNASTDSALRNHGVSENENDTETGISAKSLTKSEPADLTNHAIEFIEANREQPFLCYVPLNTPHAPMMITDTFYERFSASLPSMRHRDPEREDLQMTRAALAMVENIDWNVGRLLKTLDRSWQLRLRWGLRQSPQRR